MRILRLRVSYGGEVRFRVPPSTETVQLLTKDVLYNAYNGVNSRLSTLIHDKASTRDRRIFLVPVWHSVRVTTTCYAKHGSPSLNAIFTLAFKSL